MAVKINARGRSTAKSEDAPKRSTRKSTTKPAARATGTKRSTGSRAASTRKRSEPKASAATAKAASTRRSAVPQTDDRAMKRLLADVQKAGTLRKKAEAAHKAAVNALHDAAKAALDVGVPMARVSDVSGISRQWLYKMGEAKERGGAGFNATGNGASAAPAPATRTRKPSTRAASSTKRTQSRSAGATRPRIRAAK